MARPVLFPAKEGPIVRARLTAEGRRRFDATRATIEARYTALGGRGRYIPTESDIVEAGFCTPAQLDATIEQFIRAQGGRDDDPDHA